MQRLAAVPTLQAGLYFRCGLLDRLAALLVHQHRPQGSARQRGVSPPKLLDPGAYGLALVLLFREKLVEAGLAAPQFDVLALEIADPLLQTFVELSGVFYQPLLDSQLFQVLQLLGLELVPQPVGLQSLAAPLRFELLLNRDLQLLQLTLVLPAELCDLSLIHLQGKALLLQRLVLFYYLLAQLARFLVLGLKELQLSDFQLEALSVGVLFLQGGVQLLNVSEPFGELLSE